MQEPGHLGFGQFVPGFDFLKSITQSAAGAAAPHGLPNVMQWVAPTLSVEELDKRIGELKTVLFWLDQNALALKASVQALEVQKMSLATLKGMNVNMADLAAALKFGTPPPAAASSAAAAPTAASAPTAPTAAPTESTADPLQWWGALTQQFQKIASAAVQESGRQAAARAASEGVSVPAKPAPAAKRAKPAQPAPSPAAKPARKAAAAPKTVRAPQ